LIATDFEAALLEVMIVEKSPRAGCGFSARGVGARTKPGISAPYV
jgi:hypothetical protein